MLRRAFFNSLAELLILLLLFKSNKEEANDNRKTVILLCFVRSEYSRITARMSCCGIELPSLYFAFIYR
uniref:Putative secreted protein n=1 Tax=Anopheles darlingi TaxID=43151 RepID=A0A2M4D4U9_ANODA